jgi:NAD(P)-dependent dehydrogenase (short-subunit alcohol dehydrogenase family)
LVDVLVCNAACNCYYGPNEKLPDDVFMKVMQNNILSNMWLINLCLPDMRAKSPETASREGKTLVMSLNAGASVA